MHEPTGVVRLPSPQERRYRRFKLRCPVHLLFRSGELTSEADAVSQDVSIGGLLLNCPILVPEHSAVSFVISLRGWMLRSVELVGDGKVVRVEPCASNLEFAIAVECDNPITQIEHYLPANLS